MSRLGLHSQSKRAGTVVSKFRAIPTYLDGRRFASKLEAGRYAELKLLQQAKQIAELECQPRFRIEISGIHICDYVADFTYVRFKDHEHGHERVVEDTKGVLTDVARLKLKLMKAVKSIDVQIVRKKR